MAGDYDSPWKEALDAYFEAFLALLFPKVHAQIDWSRGYESLDKEFQQVVREAELGRRYVDKLVKVWKLGGEECWVLIHVEVQTAREAEFPERMYVYNYRVFDRYNKPVASFAVLADDDPNWRPQAFQRELFGCEAGIRFPTVKLLDFAAHEAALEASTNPFSKVVLAHLKARETHGNPADRHAWKLRLVRGLYERGFSAKDVRELFRLIDWLMELPPPLATLFRQELDTIQLEKHMPYVTSIERLALAQGRREGIGLALRLRFGDEGLKLMPAIEEIYDEEKLRTILEALETAASPEDVRRICGAGDSLTGRRTASPPTATVFRRELKKIQPEKRMPYVTSIERVGRCNGIRMGIESLLRVRFGKEGHKLLPEIHQIYEEDRLAAILKALETAASPDEVRPLCAPSV